MASKNIPITAKHHNEDCSVSISKILRNGEYVTNILFLITATNGMVESTNLILEDIDFTSTNFTLFEFCETLCFLRNKALTNLGYI